MKEYVFNPSEVQFHKLKAGDYDTEITLKLSYDSSSNKIILQCINSAQAEIHSVSDYGIKFTGVEGLDTIYLKFIVGLHEANDIIANGEATIEPEKLLNTTINITYVNHYFAPITSAIYSLEPFDCTFKLKKTPALYKNGKKTPALYKKGKKMIAIYKKGKKIWSI